MYNKEQFGGLGKKRKRKTRFMIVMRKLDLLYMNSTKVDLIHLNYDLKKYYGSGLTYFFLFTIFPIIALLGQNHGTYITW